MDNAKGLNYVRRRGETTNTGPGSAMTRQLDALIEKLRRQIDLKGKSVIVTVFGDAILPHGGSVWLGSLIRLVEPLGLNERMVRTAVFRLVADDWLAARQIGRRSYYSLTESGRQRFEAAHRRIYAPPRAPWDGQWRLVLAGDLDGVARDAVRRELQWLGFGSFAPTVFAHPAPDMAALTQTFRALDLADRLVVMTAQAANQLPALQALVRGAWDLDRLAADYAAFVDHFRPLYQALDEAAAPDPRSCFLVRTLLVHDYRRVLLRDPMLPDELLPVDWPGRPARALCRNLYRLTALPAEQHLMAAAETAEGPLPEAAAYFRERFGGLATD